MWQPKAFSIQRQPSIVRHPMRAASFRTELLVDGARLSNAIELVCWGCESFQLVVCETCGVMGCHSGDWVSVRRTADYVLFLPNLEDNWDFRSPPHVLWEKGTMLLEGSRYEYLRQLVPELPTAPQLEPLSVREAIGLLFFEAPEEIVRKTWDRVEYKRELFLATDYDSDDEPVEAPDRLLETGLNSDQPVELRLLFEGDRQVSFFFDRAPGFTEWRPLAFVGGQARLFLEPGYVVEMM